MAAGVTPNAVEPENFVELRKHFTNIQIIEILAVIAAGGYLNRWNDTIATVTDQESIDFADQVLRQVGWNEGKHVGAKDEQRKAHPITLGWSKKIENHLGRNMSLDGPNPVLPLIFARSKGKH